MSTKTIWKFPFRIESIAKISVPRGATVLCVQMQGLSPTLWAEVDPTAPMEPVFLEVIGTGHPIPEAERTYIGTIQWPDDELVWHIYQLHRLP